MTNKCPVCGYEMDRPPADFNICPSCETEFGYSDSGTHYDELRMAWIEDGAPWRSSVVAKPSNWNGYVQLFKASLITLGEFVWLAGVTRQGIYGATDETSLSTETETGPEIAGEVMAY